MNNLRYRSYLTLFIFISFRILLFLFTSDTALRRLIKTISKALLLDDELQLHPPVNDDIDVKLLIPYMLLVTIITPRNSYNTNLYGNITFFFN